MASQYVQIFSTGGGGGGVTSLNTLTGALTLLAGSNVSITPGSGTLTISAVGAGFGDINNGGNTFGIPITIGTNDNFSLSLLTNAVTAAIADISQQWSFGAYNNATRTHGFYKDVTAGESTNSVILNVGNSGAAQGVGYFSFNNQIPTNSPSFDIGFSPRNNADSGQTQMGLIRMEKSGTDDGGTIYISTSDIGGTLNVAIAINPDGSLELPQQHELHLGDAVGGQYTGFKAPVTITGGGVYTMPDSGPASNKVLQSDNSMNLSWVDQASPGGASGSLQWNNAGSFAGVGLTDGTDVTLPNNLTVTNGLFLPADLTNSLLGCDVSKTVISIPGWTYNPTAIGANGITGNLTSDPFPDSVGPNFAPVNGYSLDIVPTGNTANQTLVVLNPHMNIDPGNSGFNFGSGFNGGATLIEAFVGFNGSGSVGNIRGLNLNFSLNGNSGGTVEHINPGNFGYTLGTGVSSTDSTCLTLGVGHNTGSTMSGTAQGLGVFGQIQGSVGSFIGANISVSLSAPAANYNGVQLNPAITGVISGGAGAFFDFFNFNSGGQAAYYNSFSSNPNFHSGSTITGAVGCLGLGPSIEPGASVNEFTGIQLSPSGNGTVPTLQGININLSGLNSPAQKQGLNINDGSINVTSNFDTSVLPASPGFFGMNGIGGLYHVAVGHPTTGTLVVGIGLETNAEFEDDMGPDGFGGFAGFTNILAATETVVAVGKTVDTFNGLLIGASVPTGVIPTDGGTITNMANITAIGCQSQGGALTVTNLYGLRVVSTFSSMATNAWGIWISDPNADNWFAKNVVIGGATGKPTGAFALDVTGNVKTSGDIASATLTPANGASGTFTTADAKTVTVLNGIITSIV